MKQVAKIFQVTPLTIKRWGKRGILPPIRINSRGDRRYTQEQVLWLIGQRQEKQIQPSINRKLYEVKTEQPAPELRDNSPEAKAEKSTENLEEQTPRSTHSF